MALVVKHAFPSLSPTPPLSDTSFQFRRCFQCHNKSASSISWDCSSRHSTGSSSTLSRSLPGCLMSLVPVRFSASHEASADEELSSLGFSSRISLTCSRLSACRINSSFTLKWRVVAVQKIKKLGESLMGRILIKMFSFPHILPV